MSAGGKLSWVEVDSKSRPGRSYFYNRVTKESTWERPPDFPEMDVPAHLVKAKVTILVCVRMKHVLTSVLYYFSGSPFCGDLGPFLLLNFIAGPKLRGCPFYALIAVTSFPRQLLVNM